MSKTTFIIFISILFFGILQKTFGQKILETPRVESKLYLSTGTFQPLIVGLGGSEGGNAWASEHWRETREKFIQAGYAFLALGYFGAKNTPDTLDRIALEDVHFAIEKACEHKQIDKNRIAIIGGSRGADLALLLGSMYPDIRCVVALVPSHVAFPGHTSHFSTSAWTFKNQELPFVPVNDEAVPYLYKRDLRGAFEQMLTDTAAERRAAIPVEKINGPILLLSATRDEIIPSTPMCEKMIIRLQQAHFAYPFQHLPILGSHGEPLKHFDQVSAFLERNFPAR